MARYNPEIFDAPDVQRAKNIILTSEGPGADTDRRWELETPYLADLISRVVPLRSDKILLDYGCGIGRMSKALIETFGCTVVGVDISKAMRDLAIEYVGSERFVVLSPDQFDALVGSGLRVHAALAIWVLQHCLEPKRDIERIRRSLSAGGSMFVLNMPKRAVPALKEDGEFIWAADDVDVASLLRASFEVAMTGVPDPARTPNMADAGAFWMSLRRRER